jgi:hypothetical protein
MNFTGIWQGSAFMINSKSNCLTLSVEEKGATQVVSFDNTGRLWTAMLDGVSYRRGLDGKIVAKWQIPPQGRDRRWLSPTEADALLGRAHGMAGALLGDLQDGQASAQAELDAETRQRLALVAGFDATRYTQDVGGYQRVYQPVGILPPDQYMSVVLQLTEGCSFNTCTFCTFYRGRPFRIKAVDEFRNHCVAVRDYLAGGLDLRRTIFLGDANALVVPMRRLVPLVETVHQVFDVQRLGGIYAFLDGFSGEKKTVEDYQQLTSLGLQRVYVGLESGNADLLSFLHKPGHPEDAVQAVRNMKAGGVAVGVIVLLGAGGHQFSAAHVRDTTEVLNAMQLDADDLLYFSELVESEGTEYTKDAYQAGLRPLTSAERLAQAEEIESDLRFDPDGGTPHISRYDIREFVY